MSQYQGGPQQQFVLLKQKFCGGIGKFVFLSLYIAVDKMGFFSIQSIDNFFLLFHKNIFCGYSLEVPHWDASNEYPQHMILWRNKTYLSDTSSLLDLWIYTDPKNMCKDNQEK